MTHKDAVRLMAIAAEVAKLLRQERESQGLSMTRLAEKAGLSQQMVSYVEKGERMPTLETLLRLAAALRIELSPIIAAAERRGRR